MAAERASWRIEELSNRDEMDMNDTIHKLGNGDFETESFIASSPEGRLKVLYAERNELLSKGGNDESLNDKIRALQKETNYKVRE